LRFRALDGWRGICAVLVAAHHLEARGFFYSQPLVRNAWLFVDFFFVLSGFVIAHAYGEKLSQAQDVKAFMIRRFGRLWPLHATILAAFVVVEVVRFAIAHWDPTAADGIAFAPERSVLAVFTNLFLVQSLALYNYETWNGPSWSISTEFFTYLVFALVCLAAPRQRMRLAVSLALAIGGALLLARYSHYGMRETFHWGIVRCVYGFFLGTLTYEAWRRGAANAIAGTFAEGVALALVVLFIAIVPGHAALEYLATPLFCVAVLIFAGDNGWFSRALKLRPAAALGRWSYSIYMVHTLVLVLLFSALRVGDILFAQHWLSQGSRARLELGTANDLFFVVYIGATVGLAALTWRYIEQPGQRYFASFRRAGPAQLGVQVT
jgi:peptidoglycan/LPS O-acetylase OafA/YrhL